MFRQQLQQMRAIGLNQRARVDVGLEPRRTSQCTGHVRLAILRVRAPSLESPAAADEMGRLTAKTSSKTGPKATELTWLRWSPAHLRDLPPPGPESPDWDWRLISPRRVLRRSCGRQPLLDPRRERRRIFDPAELVVEAAMVDVQVPVHEDIAQPDGC